MSFKFKPLLPTGNGLLSQEELIFFYYEIVTKNEDSQICGLTWNLETKNFLKSAGVVIQSCPSNTLTDQFHNNTIYYTKINGESEVMAFFRHLRNAFAHLSIQEYDDYLYMKDVNIKNNITMIGMVKFDDLKRLCYIFFN